MMVEYVDVNGFVIHDLGDRSLPYALTEANFSTGPEPRQNSEMRPSAHGSINRTRWYGPRLHELKGLCNDGSAYDTARRLAELRQALALDGSTRTLRFRVLGDTSDLTAVVAPASKLDAPVSGYMLTVKWGITLEQPDPRYYRFPALTKTAVPPATATCNNPGTFATPVVLQLAGPGRLVSFDNQTTGEKIVFRSGITLAASDVLVVDTFARTVKLNGVLQPWQIDASVTKWFELRPGDNVVACGGGSQFTAATLLTVTWQEAQI